MGRGNHLRFIHPYWVENELAGQVGVEGFGDEGTTWRPSIFFFLLLLLCFLRFCEEEIRHQRGGNTDDPLRVDQGMDPRGERQKQKKKEGRKEEEGRAKGEEKEKLGNPTHKTMT